MVIHIELQTAKGTHVKDVAKELPYSCLSDAAQQMPKRVIIDGEHIYGFFGMNTNERAHFVFREKEILCV